MENPVYLKHLGVAVPLDVAQDEAPDGMHLTEPDGTTITRVRPPAHGAAACLCSHLHVKHDHHGRCHVPACGCREYRAKGGAA